MKKLTTIVKNLNTGYKYFGKAIAIIETNMVKSNDGDTHLYRIKKSFDELQKEIFRQLDQKTTDETFKKIIKKFKK